MSIEPDGLQIVCYPDPRLRICGEPVPQVTDEVRAVAVRLLELMRKAPGVGLAAPQVGLAWQLFVANHTGDPADDQVFINPHLSKPSREMDEREEGCLSMPDVRGMIRRPTSITISAIDLDGLPIELASSDLRARIWQHESDHLDGVLIIHRMTPVDRMANRRILKQLEAVYQPRKV